MQALASFKGVHGRVSVIMEEEDVTAVSAKARLFSKLSHQTVQGPDRKEIQSLKIRLLQVLRFGLGFRV